MAFKPGDPRINRRGRPRKGQSRAELLMRDLARKIVTDPAVQETMLNRARKGTLHPAILRELFHYYGGKPETSLKIMAGNVEQWQRVVDALPERDFEKLNAIVVKGERLALAEEGTK